MERQGKGKNSKRDLNKELERDCYIKARHLSFALKERHWSELSKDSNIVGMAFGRRIAHDEMTDEPAVVIYVARKVSRNFLPTSRILPRRMYIGGDFIEVDVHETGP